MERLINRLIYRYTGELHAINYKLDLLLYSRNMASDKDAAQDELYDELYVSLINDKKEVMAKINELVAKKTFVEEGNTIDIDDIIDYID